MSNTIDPYYVLYNDLIAMALEGDIKKLDETIANWLTLKEQLDLKLTLKLIIERLDKAT